jgi:hypothetical protein
MNRRTRILKTLTAWALLKNDFCNDASSSTVPVTGTTETENRRLQVLNLEYKNRRNEY